LVIQYLESDSDYHLILNPDVEFNPVILDELTSQLENDNSLSMVAPKVLFPNGKIQNSCRRYPRFFELLARRISLLKLFFENQIKRGVYNDKNLSKPFIAEYITGCFHLFRTKDFVALNGFDERYFLYMEDVDICRKIDEFGKKKLYYPKVEITHVLKQGSYKKYHLLFRHFTSMLKYFKKWGF